VLAIEAKWTEPRYKTVAKRLTKKAKDLSDPRVGVDGWLLHLQRFAERPLSLDDFADVVYQVLHRAASACSVATANGCQPQLVYLHFHSSEEEGGATSEQYVSDLRHLHSLLGNPRNLKFTVVDMPIVPTPAFEAIAHLDRHSRATGERVAAALCAGPLFTFGVPSTTII
jgi:hypothetical protein